jgi:hypothetical protein
MSIEAAMALRNGGVDAVAALDSALAAALPFVEEPSRDVVKLCVGRAMASVLAETVEPAIRAYPSLELSSDAWQALAIQAARSRAASFEDPPPTV